MSWKWIATALTGGLTIALLGVLNGGLGLPAAETTGAMKAVSAQEQTAAKQGTSAILIEKPERQLLLVDVAPVEWVSRYQAKRTYTGELKASQRSVLSFEVSGRVEGLTADEGDMVKPGMTLATLDTRRLQSRRNQLNAQLAQANARLTELQTGPRMQEIESAKARVTELKAMVSERSNDLQRQRELVRHNATTSDEVDAAIFGYQASVAQLEQATQQLLLLEEGTRQEQIAAQKGMVNELEASVELVDIDLTDSQLQTPYKGVITKRYVDPGVIVQPGTPVLEVISTENWEATIGLPVETAGRIDAGEEQELKVGNQYLKANVIAVIPDVDPVTRTQMVRFQLQKSKNKSLRLAEGQIVRLEFRFEQESEGFWIPQSALVESGKGLWACYALEQQKGNMGVTTLKLLEVLQVEAERVLVRGTLKQGETVIVSGAHRIVPGQVVRVNKAGE